jgi:hypothetical protein
MRLAWRCIFATRESYILEREPGKLLTLSDFRVGSKKS